MANNKTIDLPYTKSGKTVYARVVRMSDGKYFKSDGTWTTWVEANVLPMTEDSNQKCRYTWTGGSASVWDDGEYYTYSYEQVGASPSAANDTPVGHSVMYITGDLEVDMSKVGLYMNILKYVLTNKFIWDSTNSRYEIYDDSNVLVYYLYVKDKNGVNVVMPDAVPVQRTTKITAV